MLDTDLTRLSRRGLLASGLLLAACPAFGAMPASRRLSFVVARNGDQVGTHVMTFSGSADAPRVQTEVEMLVKLGPVPVFRYRHTAEELWSGGRFQTLETRTNANGRSRHVLARRTSAGVMIEAGRDRIAAPADAAPLTHWNNTIFADPLFNPQEGQLLKIKAARRGGEMIHTADGSSLQTTRWTLRGDAEIDNWYDAQGVWAALRGKLPDGSTMDYRRKV